MDGYATEDIMAGRRRKLSLYLTDDERQLLQAIARSQKETASRVRRARIALLADENHVDGRRSDRLIAEIVGLSEKQVKRIRWNLVENGVEQTLQRKRRSDAGQPRTMTGEVEAQLIQLCCSAPPAGRERWTVELLVDALCRLQIVATVCPETVRRTLKKTNLNPGKRNASASRSRIAPAS
jgi:transposase